MNILIQNATLLSMDAQRPQIEPHTDIRIAGNRIVEIGSRLTPDAADKVIDATDKVVMPGLINTHTHVPMSIFRETLDGYTLQNWLHEKIFPMEDRLTDEDVYYASYLSFLEMIRTGTTTANDMYFHMDALLQAMRETGVRLQAGRTDLDDMERLIRTYGSESRLTFNAGVHGLYTTDPPYLETCLRFLKKHQIPIHMHFCENAAEIDDIRQAQNDLPIPILQKQFGDVKAILVHCVTLTEAEIRALKPLNVSVVHCPISNLRLGCGIANVTCMLENGINVSLGTDGQGSGSNMDLFEVMKFTALLQKGVTHDPTKLPAYEVLKMATINGAKTLGLESSIGSITEGKLADLILIDPVHPTAQPMNNLVAELVYNTKGTDVITTIVDGKILMEDRKLLHCRDEKEIYDACQQSIRRISLESNQKIDVSIKE